MVGEVLLSEFVLLDLEGVLEEGLGLLASDGNMHCNLLISLDREASDRVFGLRFDWLLVGEILEHLSSFGELITALTGTEVENKFLDLNLSHLVVVLFLLLLWLLHEFSSPAKLLNNNKHRIAQLIIPSAYCNMTLFV